LWVLALQHFAKGAEAPSHLGIAWNNVNVAIPLLDEVHFAPWNQPDQVAQRLRYSDTIAGGHSRAHFGLFFD
jgi:hypothetical protein